MEELLEVKPFISIGGSLASDDLYLLDLRQGESDAQWLIVPVVGPTPGRRYGHTIAFCSPYLTVFGGNTGLDPVNDIWCLNVEKAPFSWARIICNSSLPCPRVYHSCGQCKAGSAAGMIIVFGGRNGEQVPLNDAWGLRRHRNDTWDWLKAPYKNGTITPVNRYQHSAVFVGSSMLVIGGRTGNPMKTLPVEIYDTETAEWLRSSSIKRFRHASWCIDRTIYVYAGFQQDSLNVPSNNILVLDFSKLPKKLVSIKEETKSAASLIPVANDATIRSVKMKTINKGTKVGSPQKVIVSEDKDFRLASQAQVAMSINTVNPQLNDFVRHIPINQLSEESRKLNGKVKQATVEKQNPNEQLYTTFLDQLLNPKKYSVESIKNAFMFRKEYVIELAKQFKELVEAQPVIIRLRTPLKVFGSLHGNFQDLMRMFDLWKAPVENSLGGDIDSVAYLFLGNYVDRGTRSLETICLLMALKLKYPETIYLLRGSHEDYLINIRYGFGEECTSRLREDINNPNSVFQAINKAFTYLPFGAIIENKMLCVHGGIGPSIKKVEDFYKINRPIDLGTKSTPAEQAILLNSLWSDPIENEIESGFKKNLFRSFISTDHIFRFGADIVKEFLDNNKLEVMIRSHEVPRNGIDTFANSRLITITSCTNYCGMVGNLACLLVIKKTLEIVPKLLLPNPEPVKFSTWIDTEETLKRRALTPPRQTS